MYIGDIRLEQTVDIKFTTRTFTTGAPGTLGGTPVVSAYPGNSLTQLTAGITLTVDFDAVTGLNNCRVVATAANGYATATNYDLVITTGTVGGVSVVGEVIGSFSIENRSALMPTVVGRTLDVSATGEAGLDWANVGGAGTTVGLTATTVSTVTTLTGHTAQTGDAFARIGAPAGASASADIAAVKADTAAVKVKTDFLPSVTAGGTGGVFIAGTNAATTITTGLTTTFTGSLTGSVGSVTGAVGSVTGLTAATVHADLDDIQTRLPAALVAGRIDASVGAMAANVITATAINADAITDAKVAADVTIASVTGAVGSVTARVTANTDQIAGIATGATRLARSTQGIVLGTVGASSTTTSIVTSALDPAAAVIDQYKGGIVTFDQGTTTANLRGQKTDITSNTALGVLTVTALTTAAVSGDTFTIT